MIRLLVFFALLMAATLGLGLVVETPGSVAVSYGGFEYKVTLAKALALLFAFAIVVLIVWSVLRTLLRLPSLLSLSNRMRRKARGYSAISRGLVSVGVGDRRAAQRFASEAERLLGRDPMTLLLKAQSAQLSGDKKAAEAAFTKMLDNPETKVLGLRGLFIEARREGAEGARVFAEEAFRLAPASPWAGQAVLEYRTADKNWRSAMSVVEESASRRVIDRDTARRQKATLLAAEAIEASERHPDQAQQLASQALKLNPGHTAAAVILAQRLAASGDYSKATRVLETSWKLVQHPDVADAYLGVRHGDSTHDRLKRARALLKLTPKSREAGLTLAKAAMDAREFDLARQTLEPLVLQEPTARACRLMAELEDREHGNAGMVRKWLSRASHAPRDPAWVADGYISERWGPVSPISGRIDAFEWTTPPQSLESSVRASIDAELTQEKVQEAGEDAQESAALNPPILEAVTEPVVMTRDAGEPIPDVVPAPVINGVAAPASGPAPLAASVVPEAETVVEPAKVSAAGIVDPVQGLVHLPDDPGPRSPEPARKKRRFFGS